MQQQLTPPPVPTRRDSLRYPTLADLLTVSRCKGERAKRSTQRAAPRAQ